ncbi:MAG: cellulose binding domain-containing protein [Bacteroidales bacterium]|nr:cellulose binding domain-containing protein [Lachnoclostridium sp.]MCM1385358.1 cellulose binding domain-containing protein [Lachnoclostridium sp.]MCM1465992.1 cellulose binding domain-containing protein [Bacteroidales bacterium]
MKKWKRKCAMLLVMILCFGPLQTIVVNATEEKGEVLEEQNTDMQSVSGGEIEEVLTEGDSVDTVENEDVSKIWDGVTMQDTWEEDDYVIIFSLNDYWQDGYTANVTIENKSEEDMEEWSLKFLLADDIANIWNAFIEQIDEGALTVKNVGWNQDIPAGGSVTFGFNASSAFNGFPEAYTLLWSGSEKVKISVEDCAIEYLADSEWENGFSSRILITNNTNDTIKGWRLSFDFARDINSIWCAEIEGKEEGGYTIRNARYNADIAPGQTISFGLKGSGGIYSEVPSNFCLYSCDLSSRNTENNQTGGKPNAGTLTEEDLETDTDGDGLTDAFETIFGLNPEDSDTDGDGLTDYEEIYLTRTSPFLPDTDENGISDAEEDLDLDGLENLWEIQYGTNPADNDTDGDNLLDNEEVNTYGTDPLQKDTDGDGLSDYDDIFLGFSPLLVDTDNNGISDNEEKVSQTIEQEFKEGEGKGLIKVCISMDASGNLENNLSILNMDQVDFLSGDVVGLVGVPIEINTTAAFETAELTFWYDETSLGGTKEEDLCILWYDLANNCYRMLEDCVIDTENNRVSYITTHFSTYMLIDSKEWMNAWRQNLSYGSSTEEQKQNFDILFVVDIRSELHGNAGSPTKNTVLNLVNVLQKGDEGAVLCVNGNLYLSSWFTDDKTLLKNDIMWIYQHYGPTYANCQADVLERAVNKFADRYTGREKVIVLISDGIATYQQSTLDACLEQGIKIYTVGLSEHFENLYDLNRDYPFCRHSLAKLAELTGGQHYAVAYGGEADLNFAYSVGTANASIDTTDTDGDGLYDIYETAGMMLPNGRIIYTDPNKADTDGDGLTDYEETGIIYNIDNKYIKSDKTVDSLKYFKMKSNPVLADTDGDGVTDDIDPHPWLKEEEWVAVLDNCYPDIEYLKIQDTDAGFTDGGNQDWWKDKAPEKRINDLIGMYDYNKYYRLRNLGCGVIAMSDMELYLTQQNPGYQTPNNIGLYMPYSGTMTVPYDTATGIIQRTDYREYVEKRYQNQYWIPDNEIGYSTGLMPFDMIWGIESFLKVNDSPFHNVEWAPYCVWRKADHKEAVLERIRLMLKSNIPVVFSYYNPIKRLDYYSSLEDAKEKVHAIPPGIKGHYMTIIGLYKYLEGDSDCGLHYEYVLKVVTWGKIYYIRYDQYADNLNYFSNILSIH